jgi:hypothetical protein
LRDRFTPMLFVHAQLVVEGEKDPPHNVSSSNGLASIGRRPCGSPRPSPWDP